MGKHKKSSKKFKRHKKEKRKHKRKSSSSESSSEHEWVEKSTEKSPISNEDTKLTTQQMQAESNVHREDWLDLGSILTTASTSERRKLRELEKSKKRMDQQYNPATCPRELNPYWKNGGTGLPEFKKPAEGLDLTEQNSFREKRNYNWKHPRKSNNVTSLSDNSNKQEKNETKKIVEGEVEYREPLTVESDSRLIDPNVIAAKLLKAEILGNTKLVTELKQKLEEAKHQKLSQGVESSEIILTETDSRGYSRPLSITTDLYGPKKKKQKVETHSNKQRVGYYNDDDKYSLNQMFEAEKYNSPDVLDKEFAKVASDIRKNDNLADLFVDKIRRGESSSKNIHIAISEHQKINKSLDNCSKCLQSGIIQKHLLIDYNDDCYLSVPEFEPLIEGHCFISPVRHVSCSVQLDENEWSEVNDFRLKLIKLFEKQGKSVIFFEIAKSFNKYPHMVLECVPLPTKDCDLAPIYFKKAIDESEVEWSHNKKLVSLKDKDVRKAVPKGLPYFFVNFGMREGFAHVIEDQRLFPSNFAQEIIGGMMDIHHSKWRKPKRENFEEQKSRVTLFNKWWKNLE